MLCGYCHLVFHPTCLDPLTGVENWDELAELNAIECDGGLHVRWD